ncbi:unnamed protein product [Phaeothamnion confervicola]
MDNYERTEKLGEGTWGIVWAAVNRKTGQKVALKSISNKMEGMKFGHGLNFAALREVKLLQEIQHENVIELVDVFVEAPSTVVLAFEVCVGDLENILTEPSMVLTPAHIKCHTLQLLRAVDHIHRQWILHRDIKPANMLYTSNGVMKLTDFGLARAYGDRSAVLTANVVTSWYRPPELLFGAQYYGAAVDVWSVGCVFAELYLRRPLFGTSAPGDLDQLATVFRITGTPTMENWPNHDALPHFVQFSPTPPLDLKTILTAASADALDLLRRMVALDPSRRIMAAEALEHEYFQLAPAASKAEELPPLPGKDKPPAKEKK